MICDFESELSTCAIKNNMMLIFITCRALNVELTKENVGRERRLILKKINTPVARKAYKIIDL